MKSFKWPLIIGLMIMVLIPSVVKAESAQMPVDVFRAIVAVNSYREDADGLLMLYARGSGVVISPDGLVLTNRHVVVAEDSLDHELESVYQVCMPETTDAEPDCFYTAKFIDADKDLDTALLRLQPIAGLGRKAPYYSIALNTDALPAINAAVTAFGYPNIGGETLTISKGTVAGHINKYGKNWLKIDAVSSFGSSGGAAIDNQGNLTGIITASNSDYAGSLGYVMSIVTLAPWIAAHRDLPAKTTTLTSRLEALSKIKNELKTANTYHHAFPPFSVTKPTAWKFVKMDEDRIYMTNENDPESGDLSLQGSRYVGPLQLEDVIENMKIRWAENLESSFIEIIKITPMKVQGAKAYRLKISNKGSIENSLLMISGEYIVNGYYSYGKNQKDQAVIEKILNSVVFGKALPLLPEVRRYVNSKQPVFSLAIDKNWRAFAVKSNTNPLVLWHRKFKNVRIEVAIEKTDQNTKEMSNDEFIAQQKRTLEQIQEPLKSVGLSLRLVKTDGHYKLNQNMKEALMLDYAASAKKNNIQKQFFYGRDYVIKNKERILTITLNVASADQKIQAQALKDFDTLLATLRVK